MLQNNKIDISVVIPTKNAGKEFEFLLKTLRGQKGFRSIELVVVDSGSTDSTVNIAKEYNAKIINILPEDFTHSYARNIGAENSSGNFLFFTVQDALPSNEKFLHNLMVFLKNNDVVAISCAEIPREDADLFYRVVSWDHCNFFGINNKDKIAKLPKIFNYNTLRQNGQLSNIACFVSKDVFMNYKYRYSYAEDLDFGIRLIKDGNKIALLSSTRIIHSHNRSAYYFLKRGYVDSLFLKEIFNDFPIPHINFNELVLDMIFTYKFINNIVQKISLIDLPVTIDLIESCIKGEYKQILNFTYPETIDFDENQYVDGKFKFFLQELYNEKYKQLSVSYYGFLINSLLAFLNSTFKYLNNIYEIIDVVLIEDLKICLYKQYALLCGNYLAYCYINNFHKENIDLYRIHEELKRGV